MSSANSVLTPWMTHWLLDPETTPANGEASSSEASSIVLCRVPSCLGAGADVGVPAGALVGAGCTPSSSCWWVEAELVCSTTKMTNEATTIRQMIQEARRSSVTSKEDTPV